MNTTVTLLVGFTMLVMGGFIRYFINQSSKKRVEKWRNANYREYYNFPEEVYANEVKAETDAEDNSWKFGCLGVIIPVVLFVIGWLAKSDALKIIGFVSLIPLISTFVSYYIFPDKDVPVSFYIAKITESLNKSIENDSLLNKYRHLWRAKLKLIQPIDTEIIMNEIETDLKEALNTDDARLKERAESVYKQWLPKKRKYLSNSNRYTNEVCMDVSGNCCICNSGIHAIAAGEGTHLNGKELTAKERSGSFCKSCGSVFCKICDSKYYKKVMGMVFYNGTFCEKCNRNGEDFWPLYEKFIK